MPATPPAARLRRDAENPRADAGLRADAVATLLENHPEEDGLDLQPIVLAVLAERADPRTALRAALKVAPDGRVAAVRQALRALGPEPAASLYVTRAHAELGDTPAALASLHHELRWLRDLDPLDRPVRSAFGAHVLQTFALLSRPAASRWLREVAAENKDDFDRLRLCIRSAGVPASMQDQRAGFHALMDQVWLEWWADQAPAG